MKKKGFTLVESIVVIGLILFLAVVFVLPAFERARKKATEVVCMSNLRQIGLALLMYANDCNGLVPPYCNTGAEGNGDDHYRSFAARRWRAAFDPYVRNNGIFFCPVDSLAGLPLSQIPEKLKLDYWNVVNLDRSVTSYTVCHGVVVGDRYLGIEDFFARGYYLTVNVYQNMKSFPRDWLFDKWDDEGDWAVAATRLHMVAVYAVDEIHFRNPKTGAIPRSIELFFDGRVEIHPCSVWRELEEYFKKYSKEYFRKYAKEGERR